MLPLHLQGTTASQSACSQRPATASQARPPAPAACRIRQADLFNGLHACVLMRPAWWQYMLAAAPAALHHPPPLSVAVRRAAPRLPGCCSLHQQPGLAQALDVDPLHSINGALLGPFLGAENDAILAFKLERINKLDLLAPPRPWAPARA